VVYGRAAIALRSRVASFRLKGGSVLGNEVWLYSENQVGHTAGRTKEVLVWK